MSRFDEVKRLVEMEAKATAAPWALMGKIDYQIVADAPDFYINFDDSDIDDPRFITDMRNAAPWLLHVAEAFRPGDAAEITATIEFLEFMADLGPCRYTGHDGKIAILRRLQAACEEMER